MCIAIEFPFPVAGLFVIVSKTDRDWKDRAVLRFVSASILLLLLCSCVQQPAQVRTGPSVTDRMKLWEKNFEQAPGTHISGLIQAWGEPEHLGNNQYRWSFDRSRPIGGYYETVVQTSRVYDAGSYIIGTIDTPMQRYVPPSIFESWCDIRITTDKKGVMTHASYSTSWLTNVSCMRNFPFPDE
ncbi:MAG: hypothetical protein FWH25_04345 [Syntrophorhabdaceae bacterium]|nr:hypothetical protein [Syntrophorhabdaceae bacterium]